MQTVGIIGGIGPESTIQYYRFIIAAYREQKQGGHYPQIVINSIDMQKMLDLIGANELTKLTVYLLGELKRLADASVDFAVLASNTPHLVFADLQKASPIPLISIVEETCKKTQSLGLQKVGLFGTKFTMQRSFYQDVFAKHHISIIAPEPKEQNYIHEKYMGELVNGIILPETKTRLLAIVNDLKAGHGIQGLILGGTELPLILQPGDDQDIPFLDTTQIHVKSIVRQLLSAQ
jgi:aspartate racemase